MQKKGGPRTAFFSGAARGPAFCSLALAASLLFPAAATAQRDARREAASLATFKRQVPCPVTRLPTGPCPGYVVETIRPLCFGGSSSPGNLRWKKIDPAAKPEPDPCL